MSKKRKTYSSYIKSLLLGNVHIVHIKLLTSGILEKTLHQQCESLK